jgi:hypothetical protein
MPGAMACRVPEGLSVSIQHLSKGMRPKADVGPPGRAPQPQLRAHLAPGASLPGLAAGSGERFRGGKWRTERDCGRTFSGLDGSLLGFLAKEFKGLFILTGEAAHPYRGQHVDICRIIRRFIG